MTFAPRTILAVRHYLKGEDTDLSDVELGIVGGPSHVRAGTSYHLGRDQLIMSKNPYSVRTARDKAGLSNAASALDIDDDLDELRDLSVWVVRECRRAAPDTLDLREVIYSPDGLTVLRWDRERGINSEPRAGEADNSHRTHTHFSWYRDSEHRDKVGLFKRFYAERAAGGPTSKGAPRMFFLQVKGNPAVYVSDGQTTRSVPAGQWDLTCKPLLGAGVPFIVYPSLESLLHAGGPLATDAKPVQLSDADRAAIIAGVVAQMPKPPTVHEIAKAVNVDAAARLAS